MAQPYRPPYDHDYRDHDYRGLDYRADDYQGDDFQGDDFQGDAEYHDHRGYNHRDHDHRDHRAYDYDRRYSDGRFRQASSVAPRPSSGHRRRSRQASTGPSPITMIRRTGVATAVVSTLGIAMVNTSGIAQSEPTSTSPTTAGALGTTIMQAPPATGGPSMDPVLDQMRDFYLSYDQAVAEQSLAFVGQHEAQAAAEQERLASTRWARPMEGRVTQRFSVSNNHLGIDIGAAYGTPIVAAHRGTVLYAGWASGYGRYVTILHENNVVTAYGHLSRIDVVAGEEVDTGEQIGLEGSTGRSTGPHLHFEVRLNGEDGTEVDPLAWLSGHGVTY